MWKQIGDFASKLFSLSQRIQKLEDSEKQVQEKLKEHELRISRLSEIVQQLVFEFQRDRENSAAERRIHMLEIENRFLRFERQLPPSSSAEDK